MLDVNFFSEEKKISEFMQQKNIYIYEDLLMKTVFIKIFELSTTNIKQNRIAFLKIKNSKICTNLKTTKFQVPKCPSFYSRGT